MPKLIKKILITGSSGTIGTALFEELLSQNYQVTGFDRKPNIWHKKLDNLTVRGDLLNRNALNRIPIDIDLIIHLAANARVYNLVVNPDLALENIITTYNILEFARKREIKNLIFSSSREIYGNTKRAFTKEEDADFLYPESPYAASKISCEALIYAYHKCYGMNYLIFRFSNVYGKYDISDRFTPQIINKMLKNKPVEIYGKDKLLDFTYIDDCVGGIILGIKKFFKVKNNTINIASGCGYKLIKVARLIKNLIRSQSKIIIKPSRAGEVIKYRADIKKAQKLLEYQPVFSIKDGIRLSVDWYIKTYTEAK